MSTIIKIKRGTTLPSTGLEVGELLFITSSGSEALHIAKSSTQTVKIGPIRKNHVDDSVQDYLLYPTLTNNSNGVVDNLNYANHFAIFKNGVDETFDLCVGDLEDEGDTTHYQFKGALRLYYGNGTVDSIICSGVDAINYTPLVNGVLLSSGNALTTNIAVANIPSTWTQIKYNTTDKKLYADVSGGSGSSVTLSKFLGFDNQQRTYFRVLGTEQTFVNGLTVPLSSTVVTSNTALGGLFATYGELIIDPADSLMANESSHYKDIYNASTGEFKSYAYLHLGSEHTPPNTTDVNYSANLLYPSDVLVPDAQYFNQLPPVDGTLLSTGHLYTTAQTGTACPVKSTGSGSNMKLYADVSIPTYSAGDDISILNNTINARDQISFIPASVVYDSTADNIVYTQQNASGKCRRNYSKYTIEENEVGNTWTLNLKFDINYLNVECFLILHDNINKLLISSKPKIFYRGDEIRLYYNNWSIIADQQARLGACYRIEVVVNQNTTGDVYAVLTVTEINYD
jgi:hypothetical protein